MGSRLGGNHLVSLTMKNLFKILITILSVNFIFPKNCEFGGNIVFNENMDWFENGKYILVITSHLNMNINININIS